jgi:hypothetical protein
MKGIHIVCVYSWLKKEYYKCLEYKGRDGQGPATTGEEEAGRRRRKGREGEEWGM